MRPNEHSVFLGRAQFRHALRLPVEEHAAVFSPPRTGKTGWLSTAVLHYPGPVLSTTTRADVYRDARSVTLIADGPVSVEPNEVTMGTISPTVSSPRRS